MNIHQNDGNVYRHTTLRTLALAILGAIITCLTALCALPSSVQGASGNQRRSTPRTPIRTYKPDNAPHITACVTYFDPGLGTVAYSIRSHLGVMGASTSIHWDVGVFNRLVADGCQWLECYVKDTKVTYRASIDTMLQHGQQQQRFGLQWVLHLRYWSINGDEPAASTQPTVPKQPRPAPESAQPALFDFAEPARKTGAY